MTSFKDFFNSKTKNPGEPSGSTAIAAVSSAVARGLTSSSDVLTVTTGTIEWTNSEKEKFAHQVGELVGSDGFVTELSDKIGKPLPGESEDEFVERAKNAMKKLLSAKLSGKN